MAMTPLEIIRGVAQAAANPYDGALDHDGNPVELGLSREQGHLVNDTRLIDGFKVRFSGDILKISYQSDVTLKDVYSNGFESDVLQTIGKAAKFIKEEFKRITGKKLSLTKTDNHDVLVQETSRIRCFVTATCDYKIGGLGDVEAVEQGSEESVDDAIKKWLGANGNLKRATGTGMLGNTKFSGTKKAQNVKSD